MSTATAPVREAEAGWLEQMFERLWPINRSIAGPGSRQTLDILGETMPTERLSVPTGERALDWIVPDEWHARAAYIVGPDGRRFADVADHNLHLVSHSAPFRGRMTLEELRPHLYSLPEQPDAIPYITSFYRRHWGFCLAHRELEALPGGDYEVVVDTELVPGRVEVGEAVLPGESDEEVLFHSYVCHPSMANNELSGPLAVTALYERLRRWERRTLTYRFVLSAETIGTIVYLHHRGDHLLDHLRAGFVLTCVADDGGFTYKRSRNARSLADRAAELVLRDTGAPHRVVDFDPSNGSDERQYCSPGFDLPIGSLMRTMYGEFPEYHTSLDNLDFISIDALQGTIDAYEAIARALDGNVLWRNTVARGEPQLGRRGLYKQLSTKERDASRVPLVWLLNLADGEHDLLAIAERSGQPLDALLDVAARLEQAGLLARAD